MGGGKGWQGAGLTPEAMGSREDNAARAPWGPPMLTQGLVSSVSACGVDRQKGHLSPGLGLHKSRSQTQLLSHVGAGMWGTESQSK